MLARYGKTIIIITFLAVIILPNMSWAQENNSVWRIQISEESQDIPKVSFWTWLMGRARINRPAIGTKYTVNSSAYASSPYQTDSTPCITAAGTRVREGTVASNFLPLGTILSINGKKYIVEDRMNSRYQGGYIDIWFSSTEKALQFGRKKLSMEILEYGIPGQDIGRIDENGKVIKGNILKRANLRFLSFTGRFSKSIMTAASNKHDIDCFATE